MIDTAYVKKMAAYNRWQNESLYGAAETLGDEERRRDRGAFFRSIHETLNHILWGDRIWLSRLAGMQAPSAPSIAQSVFLFEKWPDLRAARNDYDRVISNWADALVPSDLEGNLAWFSKSLDRELTHPRWLLVTHMFNHQTHHRGQVHAMITAAGGKPDATDLPFISD